MAAVLRFSLVPKHLTPRIPLGNRSIAIRLLSTSEETKEIDSAVVYEGSMNMPIKLLKRISLFSSCASVLSLPFLVAAGSEAVPMLGRVAVAGTVAFFGVCTTLFLNWACRPYITHLRFNKNTGDFVASTLSFFGRETQHKFHIDQVKPASKLGFISFDAGKRSFYVQEDYFSDPDALDLLNKKAKFIKESKKTPK